MADRDLNLIVLPQGGSGLAPRPPADPDGLEGGCQPCDDAAILEAAEKMRRGLRGALVGVEQLIALVTARQAGRGTDVL